MLVRRIARPMLAAVFVAGGVEALRNPAPHVKAAAPLVRKGEEALPDDVTDNVPTDPDSLVRINAGVQIGGGLLLATGKLPRLSSLVLAGTLVPTTLAGHAFWEESDPEAKAAKRTHFIKNVSLLGGLLIAAVDTEGKPSVAWRTRQGAERVASALPGGDSGSHAAENLKSAAHTAADRSQGFAHRVAESDTTAKLVAGGPALAATAATRA
ncbi:MAG: DoxX family protein, partial [Mycobacteriaceae bacterium]